MLLLQPRRSLLQQQQHRKLKLKLKLSFLTGKGTYKGIGTIYSPSTKVVGVGSWESSPVFYIICGEYGPRGVM